MSKRRTRMTSRRRSWRGLQQDVRAEKPGAIQEDAQQFLLDSILDFLLDLLP